MNKYSTLGSLAAIVLLGGCASGGPSASSTLATAALQSAITGNSLTSTLTNNLTQNMAASVLGGQLGSQLPSADQSFRLQQLGGLLQNGGIAQAQQVVNPQTGSLLSLIPTGQASVNPQTQHQCQTIQETITLPNGQTMNENRQACLNPQTGQWILTQ